MLSRFKYFKYENITGFKAIEKMYIVCHLILSISI